MIDLKNIKVCTIRWSNIRNEDLIADEADMRPEDWMDPKVILYRKTIAYIISEHGDDMFHGDRDILKEALDADADWFIFE